MSKHSVFLSYSMRDRDIAARFENALERLGLQAFNPEREVRAGEDWRKSIQLAMKRSHALVLLVTTPHSAASSWMPYEAGMAEALGKPIIALLSSKYPIGELPADIPVGEVVEFDPDKPEQAAREIVHRLVPA